MTGKSYKMMSVKERMSGWWFLTVFFSTGTWWSHRMCNQAMELLATGYIVGY